MEQNMIFCFTGTGNSLKVAKDIADSLPNCSVRPMRSKDADADISACKRVGFVFPVYWLGLPLQVKAFIAKIKIPRNFDGYFFCIGTFSLAPGNTVRQVNALLGQRKQELKYAAYVKMADNAITFYDPKPNPDKLVNTYKRSMAEIIPRIASLHTKRTGGELRLLKAFYNILIPKMRGRDAGFRVSPNCTQCGMCAKLCPANNIGMKDGTPVFRHGCEQCMACIQLCPQRAIDYKGKTARRQRYKHPDISLKELCDFHT
ncbi:MAG: EFR1 family ferrodoxin [Clostridia bacterium]|nr:EFR1 family ferrodoxin [Clostridia bacterium]